MDISLDIIPAFPIFSIFTENIVMQGTLSQNLYLGLSFIFYDKKTGNFCDFLLFFFKLRPI